MVDVEPSEACPPRLTLTALFLRFLRFGFLAFGGPVAQIAMIRRELVEQERWIDSSRFNRLLYAFNLLALAYSPPLKTERDLPQSTTSRPLVRRWNG